MLPDKAFSPGTRLAFDLVRIFASQLVVFGHAISFFGVFPETQADHGGFDLQNLAVVIFFLISGALITKSLVRAAREGDFADYFLSRFTRIYVSFLPCLVFIGLIDWLSMALGTDYPYRFGAWHFLTNIFMLQEFPLLRRLDLNSFGSGRPLWSLAVEWWIYMAMGFAWFFAVMDWRRVRHKLLFPLLFAFSSIVAVYHLVGGRGAGLTFTWLMGGLIFAFLPARGAAPRGQGWKRVALVLFSVALVPLSLYFARTEYDLRVSAALALLLGAIFGCAQARTMELRRGRTRLVELLAGYSFTLYLVHYSILDLINRLRGDWNPYWVTIFGCLACNLVAVVIAFFTERHHKAVKDWIERTRAWSWIRAQFLPA